MIKNDLAAGEGVCVSFFTQGCPHHCKGCHNPETWDFNGGKKFTPETMDEILAAVSANNIKRNFCVMGGEPLCPENQFLTYMVIKAVKDKYPDIKVYLWTGYYHKDLNVIYSKHLKDILDLTDVLIDGPYVEELQDTTLKMRGSSNQNIINLK